MLASQTSDETTHSLNSNNEKKFSFSGKLNTLGKIDKLPKFRYRWNSNEEVFTILTSLERHNSWAEDEVKIRPPNGSLLLYDRANFKTRVYHNDKYHWKTRKNSNSSRVDHSSLRIRGIECIYCSYVHSALVPTFHRRCYWLLENPDIVLVHYLNLPDKNTTHEHLVSSLLPHKDMDEDELMNQLQPILSISGDMEDNNQKLVNINIDKLVSEVKRHKKPKGQTNGKTSSKRTTMNDNPSKLRHPARSRSQISQDSEKCSNCNRQLIAIETGNASDSSPLNTNVAVTINKQNSPQHRTKATISANGQAHVTQASGVHFTPTYTTSDANSADQTDMPTASNGDPPTTNQVKDLNDNLIPSINGYHNFTEQFPMTSSHDPCRQNGGHLVLDYDGMNLIQSNSSENGASKAMEANLFDSHLLEYFPDYMAGVNGLPPEMSKSYCPDVILTTFPPVTNPQSRSRAAKSNASSGSRDVLSNSNSFLNFENSDDHVQRSFIQNSPGGDMPNDDFAESSSSLMDMISTECLPPTPTAGEPVASALGDNHCTVISSPQASVCVDLGTANYLDPTISVHSSGLQTLTVSEHNGATTTEHTHSRETGFPVNTRSHSESRCLGNHSQNIITEFSPEWSYCEGKTKILILGQWSHHDGSYSSLFDGCAVPATLIQPGVLRCFCPPHEPGLVALQVAWNEFIVSNACVFQYKARESTTTSVKEWLSVSEVQIKKLILERIEKIEASLSIGTDMASRGSAGNNENSLEDRIVRIFEVLFESQQIIPLEDLESGPKRLSLVHLAAALGYSKLIRLLQRYACLQPRRATRTGSNSADVISSSARWEPQSKDSFGCTPLMWACWRGHEEAALALLAWEPSTYDDCNNSGRSAKAMAKEMGHCVLVRKMEELIGCQKRNSFVLDNISSSPSASSSCAYLSASSSEQSPSPMSAQSLTWETVQGNSENFADFEMASVASEERPNTLGKVLVEIRTLIQEAEQRARSTQSPLQYPDDSTPFAVGFSGFSELPCERLDPNDQLPCESRLTARTSHYDALSVGSSSPIHSPASRSPGSPAVRNSPQSTAGTDTSEFEEFLSKPRKFLERDFSELTLTDVEQQELLQASRVIQNAYRQFKIRKKQQIDELKAAVLIQSYYRRYKQFALYKKITKAAVLIQNSYRAHKEHEQFKRSRHAAAVIQNYFRHYRKRKQKHAEEDAPGKRLETKYRKPSYGR